MTDTVKTDGDYRPISCASYDVYEIAIMHRQLLRLIWREQNVIYVRVVTPLDLETRAGGEFLVLRTAAGEALSIRLDRIRRVEPL